MPASQDAHLDALTKSIEAGKLKFKISTGGKKYECVVTDRATHEKNKAAKTAESGENSETTSSAASTSSH